SCKAGNLELAQAYNKIEAFCSIRDVSIIKPFLFVLSQRIFNDRILQAGNNINLIKILKEDELFNLNINSLEDLEDLIENLFVEFDTNYIIAILNEDLLYEYIILIKTAFDKRIEVEIKLEEKNKMEINYKNMEQARYENDLKLRKINKCLLSLNQKLNEN